MSISGEQLGEAVTLYAGDCLDVLPTLDADSIDSCVCDPPYGISFMGCGWDHGVPGVPYWRAVYRVLKPGAHLLAFSGTRTYHRMACAIEDAGFEVRDCIQWLYGQGFSKAGYIRDGNGDVIREGWAGSLKPANEPVVLARKPLSEKTVAANVLRWGTGAINVDGCRIASDEVITNHARSGLSEVLFGANKQQETHQSCGQSLGRWPANVIHDGSDEVVAMFPDANGAVSNGHKGKGGLYNDGLRPLEQRPGYADSGSAARFFYQAKQEERCQLCNVGIVSESFSTASILTENSAPLNAVDGQPRASAGNDNPSIDRANSAESHSRPCLQPRADTVPLNAQEWPASKIAHNVRCAANLCDLCATDIARSLAVSRFAHDPALVRFQDFISGRNAQILIHHLALYVAGRESTDIILTIPSLKQLFGSVFHAIDKITPLITDIQSESRQRSAVRFRYDSKADADDRIGSFHPTVKPVDLMQYLCRLVTPPGGTVLDPFSGTGTTGEAAWREGFRALLIEREAEYQNDIRRRMKLAMAGPVERVCESIKARGKPIDHGPLFGWVQEAAE